MYLLCILPFLARQFIPVYFKRIVREKAKAAEVDRISPVPLHFVTKLYTNRSYDFILNGNTLRIAFFFVIIPFLESSITRIVSVKLVKHFSNRRRRGRHMHALARARTYTHTRSSFSVSEKEKWGDVDLLLGMIQAVKYISYRSKGIEEPGRGLKRGLVGRRRSCKNFDFLDGLPRSIPLLVDLDDSYNILEPSSHVSCCIRVSRILMLQGRERKKGNPWSLGLDFRSSVTASLEIGPLPPRRCLVRYVFIPIPMDRPDHNRIVPSNCFKREKNTFVLWACRVSSGGSVSRLSNFYGMHPERELSSQLRIDKSYPRGN